ncbi:MAG TPA: acylphosphatase [Kiloniellales bacterium]|jgi:acylphosphatase|nr:acylphosphatase [Kiloniellales bacterium]
MAERQVRAVISGRVQGVWYRAWTRKEAQRRGLNGWVRNRKDGTVEAVFAGDAKAVDEMLAACREGPPQAVVAEVEIEPWSGALQPGFQQLPSA